MKILLLGKNGQVGWELQRSLAPLGEVLALDRHSTQYCGDLTQPEQLVQTVLAYKPDFIVNAAAYTAVDKAESEPELARCINTDAPAALAKVAAARSCFRSPASSLAESGPKMIGLMSGVPTKTGLPDGATATTCSVGATLTTGGGVTTTGFATVTETVIDTLVEAS